MGVGIQNETEKLFRQEEDYTEYDIIPFINTSAGTILVEDFEEEPIPESLTNFEENLVLEINTMLSDDSDYFLDPLSNIDGDVLDAAIRNFEESDDEY